MIPFGSSVQVDGSFSRSEWTDATNFIFQISPSRSSRIFIKHDGSNLNISFAGSLQTGGTFFPELMIDANYSHSTSLGQGDWWFHVSATDCEYQGAYGNYSN